MRPSSAPRLARGLRFAGGWLALLVGLFMLAAWAGSSIPRNPGWRQPAQGVEIMVATNGVHTALVLPARTPAKDWYRDFPPAHVRAPNRPYTHVAISWGEREVFLETPTWADLSPLTVLRVILRGGDGLLHVEHYVRPAASADFRRIVLTPPQYARLVRRIERFVPARPAHPEAAGGYGPNDAFYAARGRYHVGQTCNQWTGDTLAAAGVRIGWWTPFASGVMKWIR